MKWATFPVAMLLSLPYPIIHCQHFSALFIFALPLSFSLFFCAFALLSTFSVIIFAGICQFCTQNGAVPAPMFITPTWLTCWTQHSLQITANFCFYCSSYSSYSLLPAVVFAEAKVVVHFIYFFIFVAEYFTAFVGMQVSVTSSRKAKWNFIN